MFTLSPDEQATIRQQLADYLRRNPGGSLEGVLQVDEQGRPFNLRKGRINYLSPVAFDPTTAPTQGGGLLHSRPQWNGKTGQWETPINWGNVVSLGTAGVLTAGLANAVMGGGAAATAPSAAGATGGATSGGVLPSAAIGSPIGTVAGSTPSIGAGGLAGLLESGTVPAGMGSLTAAGTVAGGTDWGRILKKILPAAATIIPGVATGALGGGPGGGAPGDVPPELRDLLALSMQRVQDQQPLVDATNRQALRGLPTYAQKG